MFVRIVPESAPLIAVDSNSTRAIYLQRTGAPELLALLVAKKIGGLRLKKAIDRDFVTTVADLEVSSMFSFAISEEAYESFLEDVVNAYEEAFGFDTPFMATAVVYQGQFCYLNSIPELVTMVQNRLRDVERTLKDPCGNHESNEEGVIHYGI